MINLQVENFTYQMFKSIYRDILKTKNLKKLSYKEVLEKVNTCDEYFIQYLATNKNLKYTDNELWNIYSYSYDRSYKLITKAREDGVYVDEDSITLDFIYRLFDAGYSEVAYLVSCKIVTGFRVFHFNGFYYYSDITVNIFRKMPDKLWNYIKNYLISINIITEEDVKNISIHDKISLYVSCLFVWSNCESCVINSYLSQFNIKSNLEGTAIIKTLIFKDFQNSEYNGYRYIYQVNYGDETEKFILNSEKYTGIFRKKLFDRYYYSGKDFKIDSKVVATFENKELYRTVFTNLLNILKIKKFESAALYLYTIYANSFHKNIEFKASHSDIIFSMGIKDEELYKDTTDMFINCISNKFKECKTEAHYCIIMGLLANDLDTYYPNAFSFLNDNKKQIKMKSIRMKKALEKGE